MRNAQSYVPKGQQSMVAAALRQAFIQPDRASASQTLRHVADQLRVKWPKLGAFIDESETDVLAHMDFPAQHRTKIHSTDALDKRDVRYHLDRFTSSINSRMGGWGTVDCGQRAALSINSTACLSVQTWASPTKR